MDEYLKKLADKKWRMENLYYIKTKKHGRQKLKFNATQKVLHKSKDRFNATLKGRQQGVSTYYLIDYLDDAIFTNDINVAIIADKKESIVKLFRVIRYAYKYFPEALKPRLDKGGGSKYELYFPDNESRIYVSLEVRSDSVQRLHVSEYGLMKSRDQLEASLEAVPLDVGKVSIESTPKGLNHFYDDWLDKSWGYTKHFFPWFFHHENKLELDPKEKIVIQNDDERELVAKAKRLHGIKITKQQLKWRRRKIGTSKRRRELFLVEHPEDDQTCFMASGKAVLDLEMVKSLINNLPPIFKEHKGIEIYEKFSKQETYVVAGDPAEGYGGDYSVGTVYRVRDWMQCAQIRGNRWKPKEFAYKIAEMAKLYSLGNAAPLLGIERNNHGHTVLMVLDDDIHYPNLFYHDDLDERLGWNTTIITRNFLIDHFIEAIESGLLKPRSKEFLDECLTLIDNNGKVEAENGKNDDCIIASAIAVQLIQKAKGLDFWNDLDKAILVG